VASSMMGSARVIVVALVAVAVWPAAASAVVSSSPASSWQADGRVRAIAVGAHRIFIGGDFTRVRAPGASSGGVTRNHLAALSLATGKLMPWNPGANGSVTALRVAANGATVYIGGSFTVVRGRVRRHLAAVSAVRTRLRKWHANTDGTVYALAVTARRVYVGGSFTSIKGRSRHRLAAIGTGSAAMLGRWHPNANSTVRALTVSPGGGRVFAGGDFTGVNGKAHRHLVALGISTGRATRYAAHPRAPVNALRTSATTLVAGMGGNGGRIAAYGSVRGRRRWVAVTDGDVAGVAIAGSTVYVGGHFNNYCRGGGGSGNPLVCTHPIARRKALALSLAHGALLGWNPVVVGSPIGVSAVSSSGGVQIGGAFTKVHGVSHQAFARFK
jgi:hypothetical protein